MPPKPKFQKEEVIRAALEIVRREGMAAVTAREVGHELGCSSRPIFTYFISMEELQQAALEAGWALFAQYLRVADDYRPAFKMRGMQMIRFAREEPQLFQLLFMTRRETEPEALLRARIYGFEEDLAALRREYGLTEQEADALFRHLWVYTFGLGMLCVNGVCLEEEEDLARMLGTAFAGGLLALRRGSTETYGVLPASKDTEAGARFSHHHPAVPEKSEGTE